MPERSTPNCFVTSKGNIGEWHAFDPKTGDFFAGSGVAGGTGFSRTLGEYNGTVLEDQKTELAAWLAAASEDSQGRALGAAFG